jgi:hypothetical protein
MEIRRTLKSIWSNFEEFCNFILDESCIDYTPDNRVLLGVYYKWIMRRFANSEIAYDNDYDFGARFINTWDTTFESFKKRNEYINIMRDASKDDFTAQIDIVSTANNPNNENVQPDAILGFINRQNYNKRQMKINEGAYRALMIMPLGITNSYVEQFRPLFVNVFPSNDYLYGGDNGTY